MPFQINPALAENMLDGVKSSLDGGFIYIFAGTVPSDPNAALNMGTTHTQLAKLSESGDGVTGLTWETATGAVVAKETTEEWSGPVDFDGFADASPTLTPTFFRFCTSADTGRGAGTNPRLQGTVGGPASTADMKLGSDTLTTGGGNETASAFFNFRLGSLS